MTSLLFVYRRIYVLHLLLQTYVEGEPHIYKNNSYGQYGSNYPARIPESVLGGLSQKDLISLAVLGREFVVFYFGH